MRSLLNEQKNNAIQFFSTDLNKLVRILKFSKKKKTLNARESGALIYT